MGFNFFIGTSSLSNFEICSSGKPCVKRTKSLVLKSGARCSCKEVIAFLINIKQFHSLFILQYPSCTLCNEIGKITRGTVFYGARWLFALLKFPKPIFHMSEDHLKQVLHTYQILVQEIFLPVFLKYLLSFLKTMKFV